MSSPDGPSQVPRRARRIGRIALGYLAAVFALVTLLPVVGGAMDRLAPVAGQPGLAFVYMIGIAYGGLAYLLAAACGLLPALFWIGACERNRLRHPLAHALAGAAAAVLGWILFSFVTDALGDPLMWRIAADLAIAGIFGGLAYWAVAGRSAGGPAAAAP